MSSSYSLWYEFEWSLWHWYSTQVLWSKAFCLANTKKLWRRRRKKCFQGKWNEANEIELDRERGENFFKVGFWSKKNSIFPNVNVFFRNVVIFQFHGEKYVLTFSKRASFPRQLMRFRKGHWKTINLIASKSFERWLWEDERCLIRWFLSLRA